MHRGAAGVGDSLVEFAKAKGVDMVAVGSRGMGSVKRSLMSLVGLGSVSDYVLHQLHVPVLVVHAGLGAAAAAAPAPAEGQVSCLECCHRCCDMSARAWFWKPWLPKRVNFVCYPHADCIYSREACTSVACLTTLSLHQQSITSLACCACHLPFVRRAPCLLLQPRRRVCISMDDSVSSQHALEWMERCLLREGDEVHVVVVALPVPYPVSRASSFQALGVWEENISGGVSWSVLLGLQIPLSLTCTSERGE